ncbi:hypothetical protein HMI54_006152 [Coelomomyces lativittatus]|nr:hypothetical protein HMI54_006152 [Coelomomyces lativittatus]
MLLAGINMLVTIYLCFIVDGRVSISANILAMRTRQRASVAPPDKLRPEQPSGRKRPSCCWHTSGKRTSIHQAGGSAKNWYLFRFKLETVSKKKFNFLILGRRPCLLERQNVHLAARQSVLPAGLVPRGIASFDASRRRIVGRAWYVPAGGEHRKGAVERHAVEGAHLPDLRRPDTQQAVRGAHEDHSGTFPRQQSALCAGANKIFHFPFYL